MSDDNDVDLVQRREDRRTLAKMRSKLATSGQSIKKEPVKQKSAAAKKSRSRIVPIAIGALVLALGLGFALRSQSGADAHAMVRTSFEPPAGASLDDQARFWAYILYDMAKLKARFGVPSGIVINKTAARKNLEILLSGNLGTDVRNEIAALQRKSADSDKGPNPGAAKRPGR
jgi:hypothetical protein